MDQVRYNIQTGFAKSDDDKPIVVIINSCPSLGVSTLLRLLHTTFIKFRRRCRSGGFLRYGTLGIKPTKGYRAYAIVAHRLD